MLRNINTVEVCSSDTLKRLIKNQLQDDIVSQFDVGVVRGNSVVLVRNREDVMDVWKDIKRSSKVVIWCDGLKDYSQKRKRNQTPQTDKDSDEERLDGGTTSNKEKRRKRG